MGGKAGDDPREPVNTPTTSWKDHDGDIFFNKSCARRLCDLCQPRQNPLPPTHTNTHPKGCSNDIAVRCLCPCVTRSAPSETPKGKRNGKEERMRGSLFHICSSCSPLSFASASSSACRAWSARDVATCIGAGQNGRCGQRQDDCDRGVFSVPNEQRGAGGQRGGRAGGRARWRLNDPAQPPKSAKLCGQYCTPHTHHHPTTTPTTTTTTTTTTHARARQTLFHLYIEQTRCGSGVVRALPQSTRTAPHRTAPASLC